MNNKINRGCLRSGSSRPAWIRRSLTGALLLMTAGGTSSFGQQAQPSSPPSERPKGFVAEIVGMSSDDSRFLFVEDQIQRCMAQAGLTYAPQQPPAEEQDSRERRQREGFGVTVPQGSKASAIRNVTPSSPDTLQRWNTEFTRCYDSALQRAAAKVSQAVESLPPDLGEEIRSVSGLSHPVIVGGIAKWADCMAKRGYSFEHPSNMFAYVQEEGKRLATHPAEKDVSRVQANERALAVADWDCSQQADTRADLAAVLNDLEARAAAAGAPKSAFQGE